jgi:hypothetical protein
MEDMIKELAKPAEAPVAIESIPAPIPEIVEPNNNARDFGIVILIVVLAGLCYKGYLCTSKKK